MNYVREAEDEMTLVEDTLDYAIRTGVEGGKLFLMEDIIPFTCRNEFMELTKHLLTTKYKGYVMNDYLLGLET